MDHCLRIKNRKAADEAVSYLIDMGHKNIGGLFRSFDNMIYRERYEGMLDSLERHGLRIDKEKILFNVKDSEDSYQIIERLLRQDNRPGAIFASDDMLAYGVYKVAYDLKLSIPGELSVVGFDNSIMSDVIAPHLILMKHLQKNWLKWQWLLLISTYAVGKCRKLRL